MFVSERQSYFEFFFKCVFKSIKIWLRNGSEGRGLFNSVHDQDGRVKIKYFIQKGNPDVILEKDFHPDEILKIVILNPRDLDKLAIDSSENNHGKLNLGNGEVLDVESYGSNLVCKDEEEMKFASFSDSENKQKDENNIYKSSLSNKMISTSKLLIFKILMIFQKMKLLNKIHQSIPQSLNQYLT